MDRREALLLVERLKRRTRDPDVLARCGYLEQKLVDVTPVDMPFRRPDAPLGLCGQWGEGTVHLSGLGVALRAQATAW
jgi:hypothetical protein